MKSTPLCALFLVLLSSPFAANAYTRVQLFGNQRAMITISEQSSMQTNDQDAIAIYNMMNVPVQQSGFMGPGKAIATTDRELNFTCGTGTSVGAMCSVILNAGPDVSIDMSSGQARFTLQGDAAQAMAKLWTFAGQEHFVTADRFFSIDITSNQFVVQAQSTSLDESY